MAGGGPSLQLHHPHVSSFFTPPAEGAPLYLPNLMSSYSCRGERRGEENVRGTASKGWWSYRTGGGGGTHLVLRELGVVHVALVRLAVGQLPQLVRRALVQLAADLLVVAAVRQVVRREAAVVGAVDVGAQVEQAAHQRGVLEVHGQVERGAPAALFLREERGGGGGVSLFVFKEKSCVLAWV